MKLFKVSHIADEDYEPTDIREERIFLDYNKAETFYDNLNTKYYESVKYAVIKEYIILSVFNEGEKISESEEVIKSKEL